MTGLFRELVVRALLVALPSGLFGVVAITLGHRIAFERALLEALADRFPSARESCERAPDNFRDGMEGGLALHAYDGVTLLSHNPGAPPLPEIEGRALGAEVGSSLVSRRAAGGQGVIVYRGAAAGPCAVIAVRWTGRYLPAKFGGALLAAVLATTLCSAVLVLLVIAVPLSRRLRGLALVAERIAEERGLPQRPGEARDELVAVEQALEGAGERMRRDGDALAARAAALEQHLDDVAHDLRTPLATLQLSLEQAHGAAGLEEVRGALAQAIRDCAYLDGLTANLRVASRLRNGWDPGLVSVDVDLRSAVERVLARSAALASLRGVELGHELPEQPLAYRCDPVAFERLLTNLLDNAVLHNQPGGHVALTLRRKSPGFLLAIEDDGPGVRLEDVPSLSKPMARRTVQRARDGGMHGLGLTIVAELARAMGLAVEFSSRVPRGLRVTVAPASVALGSPPGASGRGAS